MGIQKKEKLNIWPLLSMNYFFNFKKSYSMMTKKSETVVVVCGREAHGGGDRCILMADARCCTAETNTTL